MSDEDYKRFLEYVFNQFVRERVARLDEWFDGPRFHHWGYQWRRLKRASDLVRYIQANCDDADDIYSTFRLERLRDTVGDIQDDVRWSNRLAEEAGFLDALEAHFDELVDGLRADYLPPSEVDILRDLGSRDPRLDLEGMIYVVKARSRRAGRANREVSVRSQLSDVEKDLATLRDQFDQLVKKQEEEEEQEKAPKKSRRWFKALGQIG